MTGRCILLGVQVVSFKIKDNQLITKMGYYCKL